MKKNLAINLFCGAFVLTASSMFSQAALAADAEFDAGLESYKAKDFNGAVNHFSKSIQDGNKTAAVFLFSGHCFANLNQFPRAYKTYEIVCTAFKGTPEATTAAGLMENIRQRLSQQGQTVTGAPLPKDSAATAKPGVPPVAAATGSAGSAGPAATAVAAKPAAAAGVAPTVTPGSEGLLDRIVIWPPMFGHQPVSKATVEAAQQAVKALPKPLRTKLDASTARIIIAPNVVDRWPDTLKDLNEDSEELNATEVPGRIYDKEMCVYERPKRRGANLLKDARPPLLMRLQVANMCFQVLDDMMTISKDPALRKEWEADREKIPDGMEAKLATFTKADDWGPRETCSELFGTMLGGHDDNSDNLYRYFPRTKAYLAKKMGV